MIREDNGESSPFDEVWNLVKTDRWQPRLAGRRDSATRLMLTRSCNCLLQPPSEAKAGADAAESIFRPARLELGPCVRSSRLPVTACRRFATCTARHHATMRTEKRLVDNAPARRSCRFACFPARRRSLRQPGFPVRRILQNCFRLRRPQPGAGMPEADLARVVGDLAAHRISGGRAPVRRSGR